MINGVSTGTRTAGRLVSVLRRAVTTIVCLTLLAGWGAGGSGAAHGQIPQIGAPPDATEAIDPNEPLADVVIEGNKTIPSEAILPYIKSQRGRPISEAQVREDISELFRTRWFYNVEKFVRPTEKGLVLVFRVLERPMVRSVEYRGNGKISTKRLEAITQLTEGHAYDVASNRECARRIEEEYHRKGYPFAKVTLLKGNSPDDRDVIFQIEEGKKHIVTSIKITGNETFSEPLLETKLRTKKAILAQPFLGGKFDPATIPDDKAALRDYYHSLGFFDVKIDHRVATYDNLIYKGTTNVVIEYTIDEGPRFKLGEIVIRGNEIFSEEELRRDMEIAAGEYYDARKLRTDLENLQNKYYELGRLFSKVDVDRRFREDSGWVDLQFMINEDRVTKIRRVNVHIQGDHPHTKETVVLNRILTHPGDLANPRDIRLSERRLENQIFERGPGQGPRVQVSPVEPVLAQAPDSVFRGQSYDPLVPQPPNPLFENSPQGDPFDRALREPPGYVDLDYYVTEARTGRLMFGAGFNSDAGVVGNIVLEENNFDIFRPPTSFHDLLNGTAWRGGGQRFRIEAIPGDIVSRYLVNWSDPYFLDTDFSFGVSGFFFNRFYPDWDEQRLGGRLSLGYQFTREVAVTGALRLEEVTIENPDLPTPPILQEAVGSNFLSSARVAVSHDTRDTPFLPAEGHFLQVSAEQAFGDFVYPRFEAEARQYFTVYRRIDGAGRHVLSLSSDVAWTDVDTPVFERYYGGGFQSFRGFAFRGISPREPENSAGVAIGGRWMFLGSAQYQFPITADENIQGVVFTDLGTVERDVGFEDFRVSVGAGLRLTIPAMGPAPIALDWAVPLAKEGFDDTRVFSFYVGLQH